MRFTKSDCLSALRAAAADVGRSPSRREYEAGEYSPSATRITDKFGTWNEAKLEAGLSVNRGGRRPKPVRTDYFAELDTEAKAYWLGFLFGDGQMMVRNPDTGKRSVRLSISEKDVEHLRRYKRAVRTGAAVVEDGVMRAVTVGDQTFAEHLLEHGFTATKGSDGSLPDLDTWLLRRGFVRGLSDADGFVGEHKWTITSTNNKRLEALRPWIPVEYDVVEEEWDDRSWAYLRVSGAPRLATLYAWLYSRGARTEPSLPRKREVAVSVLSDEFTD